MAIAYLTDTGLICKVTGDRSGLVRRERDDDRPLLTRVGDQEDTAVEVHPCDDLHLQRWPDVVKIKIHAVSLPSQEACRQTCEPSTGTLAPCKAASND